MPRPTSYYPAPRRDSQIWADWLHSEQAVSSFWDSSPSSTLVDDSDFPVPQDINENDEFPLGYSFMPRAPDSPLSAASTSLSQSSIDSTSDYDELPEIPVISSASIPYRNGWNHTGGHCRDESDDSCERSFWASVIRPSASHSSDKSLPVLGQFNERLVPPKRQRAPSVSSTMTASSRTRPAPAKSILSSSSSIRTRTLRAAPSVKFLDMPTIHYEDEYDPPLPPCSPAAPSEKRKPSLLRWFLGAAGRKSQAVPDRPTISGPFPLWETPPRPVPVSAASLRSMRSKDSLRSVRSCSSRLQTYWNKVTRKDP